MKWVLVMILVEGVHPSAVQGGVCNSIMECFTARERFMNVQVRVQPARAVCIGTTLVSAS